MLPAFPSWGLRRCIDRGIAFVPDERKRHRSGKSGMTGVHVRRDKAALFQWVQGPPGERSSRKQPGQAWR